MITRSFILPKPGPILPLMPAVPNSSLGAIMAPSSFQSPSSTSFCTCMMIWMVVVYLGCQMFSDDDDGDNLPAVVNATLIPVKISKLLLTMISNMLILCQNTFSMFLDQPPHILSHFKVSITSCLVSPRSHSFHRCTVDSNS